MRILVDTNLIARLAQPGHHHHKAAQTAIETVLTRNDDPCIVPQILYEFWVVATRPVSENGLDMPGSQAKNEIEKAQRTFTFLDDERGVYDEWHRLVVRYDVRGKPAHDARLVAAMLCRGITHLLTFDMKGFGRYSEITAISPDQVTQVPGQN